MADAKIKLIFPQSRKPKLLFASASDTQALKSTVLTAGSADFSVTVNWGDGTSGTFTDPSSVVKPAKYSGTGFVTITITGGWLDSAGDRYFAFPKQVVTRTDNEFLNPHRTIRVSKHSDGVLVFAMSQYDYAGLRSTDTIKITDLPGNDRYSFQNLTGGTLTIGGVTIGTSPTDAPSFNPESGASSKITCSDYNLVTTGDAVNIPIKYGSTLKITGLDKTSWTSNDDFATALALAINNAASGETSASASGAVVTVTQNRGGAFSRTPSTNQPGRFGVVPFGQAGMEYSATGMSDSADVSGVFVYADDYEGNTPERTGDFWNMVTSKHRISSVYPASGISNEQARSIQILNNNFLISGIGDFAFFKFLTKIERKGPGKYACDYVNHYKFTFAGTKLGLCNFPEQVTGSPISIQGVMSGVGARHEGAIPQRFGIKLLGANLKNMSYLYEYSRPNKNIYPVGRISFNEFKKFINKIPKSNLTNLAGMFEGTAYANMGLARLAAKISTTARITGMYKNCTGFVANKNPFKLLNVSKMPGGGSMYAGSNVTSTSLHWSVKNRALIDTRRVWNSDSYIKLFYDDVQESDRIQWWIKPVYGETVTVTVSGHTGSHNFSTWETVPGTNSSSGSSTFYMDFEVTSYYITENMVNAGDDLVFTIKGPVEHFRVFDANEVSEGPGLDRVAIKGMTSMKTAEKMFYYQFDLVEVDISEWDSRRIKNFDSAFAYCGKLEEVDATNLRTDNARRFGNMFSYCDNLRKITGIENWKTEKLGNCNYMFYRCGKLSLGTDPAINPDGIDSPSIDLESGTGWCTARVIEQDINLSGMGHWGSLKNENHGWTRDPYHFDINYGLDGLAISDQPGQINQPSWGNCDRCSQWIKAKGYADCD